MDLLPPAIVAMVGDRQSIAEAVSVAAARSGGVVSCHFGSIQVGAGPKTPVGVICARYEEGTAAFRNLSG